jgi:hypothetical protein
MIVARVCHTLWFKQYIYDACENKEQQPPNNMYYEMKQENTMIYWKYRK